MGWIYRMAGCVFCKIINGEVESDILYEDDHVVVIRDLFPQAPVHLLAIPREHIPSASHVEDPLVWANLMNSVKIVARNLGLNEDGYRIVVNCGHQAGQSVGHLHVHVLSGRKFRWPPG